MCSPANWPKYVFQKTTTTTKKKKTTYLSPVITSSHSRERRHTIITKVSQFWRRILTKGTTLTAIYRATGQIWKAVIYEMFVLRHSALVSSKRFGSGGSWTKSYNLNYCEGKRQPLCVSCGALRSSKTHEESFGLSRQWFSLSTGRLQ